MIAAPAEDADRSWTADFFLGGRVLLLQPKRGHRAGLDAALLQALTPTDADGLAVDLGAGIGTVAFCAAARAPALKVIAVEASAELVALARLGLARPENAAFSARVCAIQADLTAPDFPGGHDIASRSIDQVLMNPPFDVAGQVRASPDDSRRSAHVAAPGTLGAWCLTAANLLRSGGRLGLIHRAGALPAVMAELSAAFGDIRVRPVHPAADRPAGRILVTAIRGSRAKASILPPLVLHQPGGRWSEHADAVLRGIADLAG